MDLLARFVGVHFFHLSGRVAEIPSRDGDSALAWVSALIMLLGAVVATATWCLPARERNQDDRVLPWFRLVASLLLGTALLEYGFLKVFPLQFPLPPVAVLNEPVGSSSPTMLFWTLYGLHPVFQIVLGCIEITTGLLLLFRRTAFAGALFALGVTANVALLDLAFDIPVKLFAVTLVLLSVALLVSDAKRLRMFLLRQPDPAPPEKWAPEATTIRGRRMAFAAEIIFAVLVCWQWGSGTWSVYRMKVGASRNPAPFTGEWEIQGQGSIMSGNNTPITTISFDPDTDVILQDASGAMWRSRSIYDRANKTLRVLNEVGGPMMFRVDQPNDNFLRLEPIGPTSKRLTTINMTRKALPENYPLLEWKYHWTNDFEPVQ
jgi:hypothetical protein